MAGRKKYFAAFFLALIMLFAMPVQSMAAVNKPENGEKKAITIGYCGEEYTSFSLILSGVCQQLYKTGMLSKKPSDEFASEQDCWDFICENVPSSTGVIFKKDAFFNLTTMSDAEQKKALESPKADLMIAMGSTAAKLFLKLDYKGDYIVAGANNVYKIGTVESLKDSGVDNRCALIYDDIYIKQVQSVCEIFKFERMGVVYENSQTAFEYSGIGELRKQSKEKGFSLFEKNLNEPVINADYEKYLSSIKEIYKELATKVDIFYLTINQIRSEDLVDALKPFYDKKIPVISQQGSREVQSGALFGISMTDEQNYGALLVDMITDYLSGQPLRYMSRVFHSSPKISLNISVAKKIDFSLDFKTMLICDEVYKN